MIEIHSGIVDQESGVVALRIIATGMDKDITMTSEQREIPTLCKFYLKGKQLKQLIDLLVDELLEETRYGNEGN